MAGFSIKYEPRKQYSVVAAADLKELELSAGESVATGNDRVGDASQSAWR